MSTFESDQMKHSDVLERRIIELASNGWEFRRIGFQDKHTKDQIKGLKTILGEATHEYKLLSLVPDIEVINPITGEIDHYEEIKGWKLYNKNEELCTIFPEAEQILYNIRRNKPVWYFTWFYPTYSDNSVSGDPTFLYCSAWDLLIHTSNLLKSIGGNTKTLDSSIQQFELIWGHMPRNKDKRLMIHEREKPRNRNVSDDIKAVIDGKDILRIIELNKVDRHRKPIKLVEEYLLD